MKTRLTFSRPFLFCTLAFFAVSSALLSRHLQAETIAEDLQTAPAEVTSAIDEPSFAPTCETYLDGDSVESKSIKALHWSTHAAGIVVGSTNGIIMTLTGASALPPALNQWLPFFNEIANVASTSSGQRWIYSGLSKSGIDGVALGTILGQTAVAGSLHGALAAAVTFGASVGLSYWLPNSYLSPIMKVIPKILPRFARRAAESAVGQGVIGMSLVSVLESVLNYAQHLAQLVPHLFAENVRTTDSRMLASVGIGSSKIELRQALALFFLDAALSKAVVNTVDRQNLLLYLAGDLNRASSVTLRLSRHQIRTALQAAKIETHTSNFRMLLTQKEASSLRSRIELLNP